MKAVITILCIILTTFGEGQTLITKKEEIKGTGLSIALPDTSFQFIETDKEKTFFSKKVEATIGVGFLNELATGPYKFEDIVAFWLKEMSKPGMTIEFDSSALVSNMTARFWKVRLLGNGDNTRQTILWMAFYNFNDKALQITGMYKGEVDTLLSPAYKAAFLSIDVNDKKQVKSIFKESFSITQDYSPLQFVAYSLGGYMLSDDGKFPGKKKKDFCLVVPYKITITEKEDVIRDLLNKRLLIHYKKGDQLPEFDIRKTITDATGKVVFSYSQHAMSLGRRKIVFLAIKTDEYGYFEIWGEAYGKNAKEKIMLFRKIAESIKRDVDQ